MAQAKDGASFGQLVAGGMSSAHFDLSKQVETDSRLVDEQSTAFIETLMKEKGCTFDEARCVLLTCFKI
jgi:hypothetical protein